VSVKHIVLDARKIVGGVVSMVADRRVKMGEEYFEQDIRGDIVVMIGDYLLRLKEFPQVVERDYDFVTHGQDEVATDDKIYLLDFLFITLGVVFREMEHEECCPLVARDKRRRGRGEQFCLHPLVYREFVRNTPYLVFGRSFKIDPYTIGILVPENHAFRIPYMVHCSDMEAKEAYLRGRAVAARGISIALVAALAFGAGLAVAGGGNSAAAVVSRIPLIGDGLDATPVQGADLTDFWKAWNALETNYVITHASSTLPSSRDRVLGAIEGLASSYNDPYTVYFPPKEAKEFSDTISGSFAGVGMEVDVKDGVLTVIAPLKGTPAESAGIKAGDQILAIDGKSTDGVSTDKAVSEIRGPIGTTVDLSIIRDGKSLDIKITRQTIQIPETDESVDEATGTYRIALYEFTSNSADLFAQAFARFQSSGSQKLVIDLRGNPGGYLDAAVDIASHFLPKGAKIVTEDFGGKEDNVAHTSYGYADLPKGTKVVVLVDNGSASASEILAGALQDNKVATVIGTQTFGKGSVQTLIDLGGGSLKVTVARWITPAGHWIMGNGVTPDITVAYKKADTPKGNDSQMTRAIQFLTTGK